MGSISVTFFSDLEWCRYEKIQSNR